MIKKFLIFAIGASAGWWVGANFGYDLGFEDANKANTPTSL